MKHLRSAILITILSIISVVPISIGNSFSNQQPTIHTQKLKEMLHSGTTEGICKEIIEVYKECGYEFDETLEFIIQPAGSTFPGRYDFFIIL